MALLLLVACATPLADPTSLVDTPRTLAVRVEPAEAEPGAEVRLTSLYADAGGELQDAPVEWAFCTALKPLAELGPVAPACVEGDADALVPIGTGREVTGLLPDDGCSRFGPNPPPAAEGEAAGRPTDPDVTGGYYQPAIGFDDGGDRTLVQARIRCGLAYVTQELYVAWNRGYHSNRNPEVEGLTLDGVDVPPDGTGTPPTVAPGTAVELAVRWPTCPDTPSCGDGMCTLGEDLESCPDDCEAPVGCAGAEGYVVYDPASGSLGERREAVSVTWFTTGGTFAEARGGRDGDDPEVEVANTWTAPETPASVWLAAVLRDERGGVAFAGYRVEVGP